MLDLLGREIWIVGSDEQTWWKKVVEREDAESSNQVWPSCELVPV